MMLSKYFRIGFIIIFVFALNIGMGQAGNTDDLTGSKLIISHDWKRSTGVGEITFTDDGATGGGDFKRIGKIKRKGNTLTIRLHAYIFSKSRSSRLVWDIGSPTAVMKILDCQRNCTKSVRVEYLKSQ